MHNISVNIPIYAPFSIVKIKKNSVHVTQELHQYEHFTIFMSHCHSYLLRGKVTKASTYNR